MADGARPRYVAGCHRCAAATRPPHAARTPVPPASHPAVAPSLAGARLHGPASRFDGRRCAWRRRVRAQRASSRRLSSRRPTRAAPSARWSQAARRSALSRPSGRELLSLTPDGGRGERREKQHERCRRGYYEACGQCSPVTAFAESGQRRALCAAQKHKIRSKGFVFLWRQSRPGLPRHPHTHKKRSLNKPIAATCSTAPGIPSPA